MTSTNLNPSQQAVLAFQRLKIDDRLAVLGLLLPKLLISCLLILQIRCQQKMLVI